MPLSCNNISIPIKLEKYLQILQNRTFFIPVSLIKPYRTRDESQYPQEKTIPTLPVPIIAEPNTSALKVHKILKEKKERKNGKDIRLYLVRWKNQSADKDEWLPADNIPDGQIHLRNFRLSKRQ
ncbi:hypothetical protein BY996DRAFT_6442944 [Phakopsora pachyrhizi]|nr:hypothetical protein BY996DRAFT_6442944 [Phakopsora pachyrhizi]